MTAVISEISDFDYFLNILKSHIEVSFQSQIRILESYLVWFLKFWNSVKILSKREIFHDRGH